MELTRNFTQLSKNDAHLAGGKGASLGEMTNAGIPVPPGFVVLSDSFEQFIKETDLIQEIDAVLSKVNHKEIHTVEAASETIRALILNAKMPKDIADDVMSQFKKLNTKYVAVRSSATAEDGMDHAWAGQLESYLNTEEDQILEKVKLCWSSLFTPRAIFYRFEKSLHTTKISVAVVVQKMVESEVSGIAFSVHPVTQDYNQLIIEAGFGLGEAIVSGSVTPDSYVVEKEPRNILDINISTQERGLYRSEHASVEHGNNEWIDIPEPKASSQVLTKEQILELSEIILGIEKHYGFPCDIEWAFEKGKFYIVQSRPITTLSPQPIQQTENDKKKEGLTEPSPKDYVRMFAANSAFSYILSEAFLGYYKDLGVVCVQDEQSWMTFLPKKTQEQTLKEGKELYSNKKLYGEYRKAFDTFMEDTTKYFGTLLRQEVITASDIEKAFKLVSKHFSFYSKTEFFYTDLLRPEDMVLTVQEFDKLKLDGRAYLNKMIFEGDGYIRSLITRISKQTNVPESDLYYYKIEEIIELEKTGIHVSENTVKSRHIFFLSKDFTQIGGEAKPLTSTFLESHREISSTIKGTIAYGGKVRGKARVILLDFKNFEKVSKAVEEMREGEILVTETTAPEIIQACKKAAAIVTNQGGMLSHAAIVSRELKIPCIVGADKDVTLNIKTGDLIEVDADKGIVRIIK